MLSKTRTLAESTKNRASKQHIFKTPSPWNWNVSLDPIWSPPLKTFLPNLPLRYLYIFSPNLWGLSRFCLFSISITLSQKNAPKRESVSVFLFITIRFLFIKITFFSQFFKFYLSLIKDEQFAFLSKL